MKEITKKGAKFVDGQEMEFESIILATGYKSNVPDWLEVRKTYIHYVSFLFSFLTCPDKLIKKKLHILK